MQYRNGRVLSALVLSSLLLGCNSDDNGDKVQGCMPMRGAVMQSMASSMSLAFEAAAHIPKQVQADADRGTLDQEQELSVTVSLQLNHEDELDRRIFEMYTPGTPGFRRFLTPEEFYERYSPTQEQIDQVQAYLYSQGIKNLSVNPNRFLISGKGSVRSLNSAFRTEIRKYKNAQGANYYAPSREPSLPHKLGIRAVHGLNNVAQFKSFAREQFKPQDTVTLKPQAGSGPYGGLSPQDIRKAYRVPSTVSGAGQTIALIEFDGYNPSDIAAYVRAFGLPSVPLQNVLVSGASGAAGAEAAEVTLDIELAMAMAPGASRILVYEAPNSGQGALDMYSRIANDNLAQIVSTSWGGPESAQSTAYLISESGIMKQMAAQGQTIFAAAGDAGAYSDQSKLSVIDPASQPFVVAVGGTRLNTSSGSYGGETTWNGGAPNLGAGGGGVSSLWVQPSWQNGFATSANRGSNAMRNVPDVALNADPATGYAIYLNGRWTIMGGTSAAAPLWAGFTALVNEQRSRNGLRQIGFLNPILYSIGRSSRYSSDFNDIRDGSTNLYYPAVPGYDNATGWGSFNGQGLFEDLSTDSTDTSRAVSC